MANLLEKIVLVLSLFSYSVTVSAECSGRFVNPIRDVCWSCLLPVTIGSIEIGSKSELGDASKGKKKDIENPSVSICSCPGNGLQNALGVTIGYWEPAKLFDISYDPYCFVGLGGIKMKLTNTMRQGSSRSGSLVKGSTVSYAQTHMYTYPLVAIMNLLTDAVCSGSSTFTIPYISEIDPTYTDHFLSIAANPENLLFANPLTVIATDLICAKDCHDSTYNLPNDNSFYCAGCSGSIYPISGFAVGHFSISQQIMTLTHRTIYKMHKLGLLERTSTSQNKINGEICRPSYAPRIKKSQYKLQMTYPVVGSSQAAIVGVKNENQCVMLGTRCDLFGNAADSTAFRGNAGVMLWRKRNCCLF